MIVGEGKTSCGEEQFYISPVQWEVPRPSLTSTLQCFISDVLYNLIQLTLPYFPTMRNNCVQVRKAYSPTRAFFISFAIMGLVNSALHFVAIFNSAVRNMIHAIVVTRPSTGIVTITMPFYVITLKFRGVNGNTTRCLVTLSPTIPWSRITRRSGGTIRFFVRITPFIIRPTVCFFYPFFVTSLMAIVIRCFPL